MWENLFLRYKNPTTLSSLVLDILSFIGYFPGKCHCLKTLVGRSTYVWPQQKGFDGLFSLAVASQTTTKAKNRTWGDSFGYDPGCSAGTIWVRTIRWCCKCSAYANWRKECVSERGCRVLKRHWKVYKCRYGVYKTQNAGYAFFDAENALINAKWALVNAAFSCVLVRSHALLCFLKTQRLRQQAQSSAFSKKFWTCWKPMRSPTGLRLQTQSWCTQCVNPVLTMRSFWRFINASKRRA